jgi:hypothetical protein
MTQTTIINPETISDRDLDALAAEHLFGWKWYKPNNQECAGLFPPKQTKHWFLATHTKVKSGQVVVRADDWSREVPRYSGNMQAAWSVIEKMRELGYWVKIVSPWTPKDNQYHVGFDNHRMVACGSSWVQAVHENCARAICLAALFTIRAINDTGYVQWKVEALAE